jgi:ABC-type sugar transport system ATPase subunit
MIACGFRRAGARRTRRLTDVFTVCDRVVALRQGRGVSVEPTARASMNAVVTHIVVPAWTNLSRGKWRAEG